MLELADIEPYLRDRGLISARAVVDGGLQIADVSRLNRVYLVTAENERSLVVKVDARPGRAGVAREAAIIERLSSRGCEVLTPALPVVIEYDEVQELLVLETHPGVRDLATHHARGRFSCALAAQVGRVMARLHETPVAALEGLPGSVDPSWPLQMHRPDLGSIWSMSSGAIELTRLIQSSDEICMRLDELLASWNGDAVIHGDARWDNLLAIRAPGNCRWRRIQLIDWELGAPGDPSFDIGVFLGDYLRAWLESIPIVDVQDPGRLAEHAQLPLRRMRPAIQAFWRAYAAGGESGPAVLGQRLARAVRFAAGRLLMAALEHAQNLTELDARTLSLVPLSENVLRRPQDASTYLLGLGALPGRS